MNPQRESRTIISINDISLGSNIPGSLNDAESPKNSKEHESSESQICPICYDTITTANYSPLSTTCSHIFCMPCFKEYLTTEISSLQVLNIPCPYSGCRTILTEKIIQQALDKEAYQNYQDLVLKKIMNRNPDIKFCPQPGCSKQFKPSKKAQYTKCSCGVKICNICCQTWHEGKTCLEAIDPVFELFVKDQDIRFCMMCKSNVQLVQGCKHITCPVCDYEWCWDCGRQFHNVHQAECPKTWSPVPPQIRETRTETRTRITTRRTRTETGTGLWDEFMKTWRETSKAKIILIFVAVLFFPITIVVFLVYVMWHNSDHPILALLFGIDLLLTGIGVAVILIPLGLLWALVWGLKWIMDSLYRGFHGGYNARDNGRPIVEKSAIKRWVSGDTKSFGYTAHSKPDIELVVQ